MVVQQRSHLLKQICCIDAIVSGLPRIDQKGSNNEHEGVIGTADTGLFCESRVAACVCFRESSFFQGVQTTQSVSSDPDEKVMNTATSRIQKLYRPLEDQE